MRELSDNNLLTILTYMPNGKENEKRRKNEAHYVGKRQKCKRHCTQPLVWWIFFVK